VASVGIVETWSDLDQPVGPIMAVTSTHIRFKMEGHGWKVLRIPYLAPSRE
jgi:hypothetical protein